ncbi:hypothetical protein PINS_up003408 [Pythium insidiosum]|nr:hypothetical protein PINS_up003408 [Pythium insidiosum]
MDSTLTLISIYSFQAHELGTSLPTLSVEEGRDRRWVVALLARALLEVARRLRLVVVHVRVRLAARRLGTLVAALARADAKELREVVAEEIRRRQLTRAALGGVDALVVADVPWLAVLVLRTALRPRRDTTAASPHRSIAARVRVRQHRRDGTDLGRLAARALLQVAVRLAVRVVVDERVRLASRRRRALVTAVLRERHLVHREIVAVVIHVDLGETALVRLLAALVLIGVPRLAVLTALAALRTTPLIAATAATRRRARIAAATNDSRHGAGLGLALAGALLQVAVRLAVCVVVDERVRRATLCLVALGAALLRQVHLVRGKIFAVEVHASLLASTLGINAAALVLVRVPWLAVLVIRARLRTDILVATGSVARLRRSTCDGCLKKLCDVAVLESVLRFCVDVRLLRREPQEIGVIALRVVEPLATDDVVTIVQLQHVIVVLVLGERVDRASRDQRTITHGLEDPAELHVHVRRLARLVVERVARDVEELLSRVLNRHHCHLLDLVATHRLVPHPRIPARRRAQRPCRSGP